MLMRSQKTVIQGYRPIKIVYDSSFFKQETKKLLKGGKIKIPSGYS